MINEKFNLSGKTTILTGATGLIGKALAFGFAEQGSNLILCDLDKDKCDDIAKKIVEKYPVKCFGINIDVSKRGEVKNLVNFTIKKFNKIDILLNFHQNKTVNFFEKFESYSEKDLDDIINVNLKGVFFTCQEVGIKMVEKNSGSIVNAASTYAVVAPNHEVYEGTQMGCPAAYSASKGGVLSLTKYLAAYWSGTKIRVNSICPHGVYNTHEKKFVDNFSKKSPMHRMSYPNEIVEPTLFLASDASSYITGHNLMVDGGWSIW